MCKHPSSSLAGLPSPYPWPAYQDEVNQAQGPAFLLVNRPMDVEMEFVLSEHQHLHVHHLVEE